MPEATEQEFLNLVNANKGIIHKITKMYMDTSDDRKDLFQEIVLQLWKAYPGFKGNSKFSTWMYRVSLNTALVFLRKESRKVGQMELDENIEVAADTGDSREQEERLALFYTAVQELNKIEKALIFLFLENQSHKDIAQNLGITEGNARVKLNRTKEKLQQIIKKNGYEF